MKRKLLILLILLIYSSCGKGDNFLKGEQLFEIYSKKGVDMQGYFKPEIIKTPEGLYGIYEIDIESKRQLFFQHLYSKAKERYNSKVDSDFETFKSKFIEHFYDMNFVISVPKRDDTKLKRIALEERKIVLSMTEYEFYIVLGDTSHLKRKSWINNQGTSNTEFYESKSSLPYGKVVYFINGFLEGFDII